MPYVYLKDGSTVWVDSEEEANKLWSGGGGSTATATAESGDSKESKGEEVNKVETKEEDDGTSSRDKEFEEKYLKGYVPPKKEEKPVVDKEEKKSKGVSGGYSGLLGGMPDIDRPSWKEETAREMQEVKNFLGGTKRVLGGIVPKAIDETVGSMEVGGVYAARSEIHNAQAIASFWDSILGTKSADAYDTEVFDPYLESLEQSGTDEFGNPPGFKPGWIGYDFINPEGEIFKKHFGPKHWGEALLQDIGGAFLLDVGMTKYMKGIGLISKVDDVNYLRGFYTNIAKKEFTKGLENLGRFTLRELVPDATGTAVMFKPDPNAELDAERFWVRKLPREAQEYAWAAILAENPTDYNYNELMLREFGLGAAGVTFLHTAILVGRRSLKYVRQGMEAEAAAKLAAKEVAEETGADMDLALDAIIKDQATEGLGVVNRDIESKIEGAGKNISQSIRAGSKKYADAKIKEAVEVDRLTKELNVIPDDSKRISLLNGEIEDLQKNLGVETGDDITARLDQLGRDYEKYEALGKPNKLNNVIDEISDLIRLQEFIAELGEASDNMAARAAKGLEIGKVVDESQTAGIGFGNGLNDGRILLNKIHQLVEQRGRLLDLEQSQLVRESRYTVRSDKPPSQDILSTGIYHEFPGALGQAYRMLDDIVKTADTALASNNLNSDLIAELGIKAQQVEELISNNGGLKPVVSEASEEIKDAAVKSKDKGAAEEVAKREEVIGNQSTVKAPIDENPETGNYEVNKDEIGARRGTTPPTPSKPLNIAEEVAATNKENGINQVPEPEELHQNIVNKLEEDSKLQELDDIDNGNRVEEASTLSRTAPRTDGTVSRGANAGKITNDPNGKALLVTEMKKLQGEDLNPQLYAQAIRQLGRFFGDSADILARKREFLEEATKVGTEFYKQLPKIIVTMSLIEDSTAALLRSIRDIRQVNSGINVAISKEVATKNFVDNYLVFRQNLAAVDSFYQSVGNAMRAFGPAGRVQILDELVTSVPGSETTEKLLGRDLTLSWSDPRRIKVAVDNLGKELKNLGDDERFASALIDEAKKAKVEVDNEVADFMKKFDEGKLTDQDVNGIENLMESLEASGGNLQKLKNTAMSSKELMSTLHSGHVLSNFAFPFSIPMMGQIGMATRLSLRTGQYYFSGLMEALLVKRGLGSAEEMARLFKQARHSRRWLIRSQQFHLQGLESAKNSFLFNRAISDPAQVKRADLSMTSSGMSREEQILQSLRGEAQHNTVWAKWLLNTFKDRPGIVKAINEAITLGKVFHDYTIPGEAWKIKPDWQQVADWPVDATQWATGKFRGGEGFGTKSYFPQGERVNMSLFQQLASAGDEAITAQYARGSLYADAMEVVDQKVTNGTVDIAAYGDAVRAEFKKMQEGLNSEVRVGFDQQTIGNSFLDQRALELIRQVNQTEELTGPLGSVKNAVELLRNDNNPAVAFSARFIWPIINSPLVAVKQAAKYAYGFELARLPVSLLREGGGYLTEKLGADRVIMDFLGEQQGAKAWYQKHVIDFESAYFSKDPVTRDKARNAFALAAGIQAVVATIVWDENSEVTSGLDDTYKVAAGRAERFRILIGGQSIPYRYIPLIGEAIAFQASLRDIVQFNPDYDGIPFMNVMTTAMSTQIMDMPGLAGLSTVLDAIGKQKAGDGSAMMRIAQQAYTRLGVPYTEAKKSLKYMFDDRKTATTREDATGPSAFLKGKIYSKDEDVNVFKESALGIARGVWNIPGMARENEGLTIFTDWMYGQFNGDPDYRLSTRKAVPFGKPEETVRAETAPWYTFWMTIFGRYRWGNNDLTDPVNRAIVNLSLSLPDKSLFNSFQGRTISVGINDKELNNFNHFFNTEYKFTARGKQYVGINSYIRDLVKDPQYTKYDAVDSPYKIGVDKSKKPIEGLLAPGLGTKGDWVSGNTKEVERRMILKSNIDEQINKAKIQFLMGNTPGQRFKASQELKNLVLEAYSGGSN